MNTIEGRLENCYKRYLALIVNQKNLRNLRKEASGMGALYEAEGENVFISLVNDRGCVNYDIRSKHRKSCYCDGELLAEVLNPREEKERKRSIRRVSLEDQTQLFLQRWEEIESMMDEGHASETGKALNRFGSERSRVMFK